MSELTKLMVEPKVSLDYHCYTSSYLRRKTHAVPNGTDVALCGYNPEMGWDHRPVSNQKINCKKCLKSLEA